MDVLFRSCTLTLLFSLFASGESSAQVRAGNLTGWTQSGTLTTFHANDFRYHVRFVNDRIVRVDVLPLATSRPETSLVVVDTSSIPPISVSESDSSVSLSSGAFTVIARKYPLRLEFQGAFPGTILTEPNDGGAAFLGDQRTLTFALSPDDHVYGSGPRGRSFDLRGTSFDVWNTQTFGYGGPLATMNANVPFFVFSSHIAVLIDHWYRGHADFGSFDPERWTYHVSGGEVTYFVMSGTYTQELLDLYVRLTGPPPLPPRWSLGYIQSKFGYQTAAEALTTAWTLRTLSIPADGIVLDLYWFKNMGDLAWNLSAWPDPPGLLTELKALGFKTVTITEPFVTEIAALFSEGNTLGHFGKDTLGSSMLLSQWWSCNCNAVLVDMTSPAARAWWWSKHLSFMSAGVDGLWTDLGEPERHPDEMVHAGGSGARIHNHYNFLWAQAINDGWLTEHPNRRLFHLTRSGWAGIQRFGTALWSGDVAKSFEGLAVQAKLMLNAGLSGLGWYHSDIGGYCCGSSPSELYIRWLQLGTFAPVMRAHGSGGPTEPWGFGDQALSISREFIQLRYRLLPYLYTLSQEYSATGVPPVRPLFFSDPANGALANESRAWLFGSDLLVAPVVTDGARSVVFNAPAGEWVDWWSGATMQGGTEVTAPAPLERIPIFVRSGSILPLGPVMRFSDERPLDTLTLLVHPRTGVPASTAIYEDDGISRAYRQGALSTLSVEQTWTQFFGVPAMVFQYTSSGGSYAGKPLERTVVLDIRRLELAPLSVNVNGRLISPYGTWSEVLQAGEGGTFDPLSHRLLVQFRTGGDSAYQIILTDARLTGAQANTNVPETLQLEPNYPNPFNGETRIRYRMEAGGWVKLKVVDVLGRIVAVLEDESKESGMHTAVWNAGGVPSGTYFCTVQAGGKTLTRRMMLLR